MYALKLPTFQTTTIHGIECKTWTNFTIVYLDFLMHARTCEHAPIMEYCRSINVSDPLNLVFLRCLPPGGVILRQHQPVLLTEQQYL